MKLWPLCRLPFKATKRALLLLETCLLSVRISDIILLFSVFCNCSALQIEIISLTEKQTDFISAKHCRYYT